MKNCVEVQAEGQTKYVANESCPWEAFSLLRPCTL